MEENFELNNKDGLKIRGKLSAPDAAVQTLTPIILLNGFKGYMEQPFLRSLAQDLAGRGYAVFRFDATNGIGESEGDIFNCTVTNYLKDTLTVLDYVSSQPNLNLDRLTLFGTSMGGLVATLAAGQDQRVKFLVAHSAALDWRILKTHPDIIEWREGEWIEFISKSQKRQFKVDFNFYTDGLKYDAYTLLKRMKIPKLFLHSGKDEAIPLSFSQRAYDIAIPPRELIVVSGATHSPDATIIQLFASEIDSFLKRSWKSS